MQKLFINTSLETYVDRRYTHFVIIYFLLVSLLLFSSLSAQSQEQHQQRSQEKQLVRDITLVDQPEWIKEENKNTDNRLPLPEQLIIGIDMVSGAFYKLTAAESKRTITGGTLAQGMNMIALSTDGLFQRSGSYTYVLGAKAGEIEQEEIIILEIEVKSDSSGSFGEIEEDIDTVHVKPRIYEVSMFVGRKHISSMQKKDTFLSRLLKDALKKRVYRAYDPAPLPDSRPAALSISPLTLAYMAFKAIKKRRERKKREEIRHVHTRQISGGFSRKDKEGKEKPVDITIKISRKVDLRKK